MKSKQAPEDSIEVVRPSIKFEPDRADFEARVKRLEATRDVNEPLPKGFPRAITGPRVWYGRDIGGVDALITELTKDEIAEVEAALQYFKGTSASRSNNGPDQMSKELFPLPKYGAQLEQISKDLHSGRGITILRGLNPENYSATDNVLLFAGIASHIGEQRGCQDRFGNMLTHLVDMGFKFGKCSKRTPTFTGGILPYHNDVCDILCMYIQDSAANGGESTLASSATVYNRIAASRPDMVNTLAAPIWVYDKDKPPEVWHARPILFGEKEHGPFFCFSRQKITGSEHYPLSQSLPAMSEEQAEALDMIHYVAEETGITMSLKPGDMLLYNNLGVLHGRNAFTDAEVGDHRRHILRLWVRNEERAWDTPEELAREWHLVYGDSVRRARAQWRMRPEDTEKDRVIGHKSTCS
ncbi:Clavaminate synthase-like protein [Pseudovirgaria hyperparasitica]|uniref:Clavaminate synthase-like protein n=1 Tax=Pseudovirgaria hyperparasitica TaxID=470096 RepID=A0A6A6WI27_9PEZI|nr:Clavaminate synthase-like protein [Pseudovirgaria hyperparasitica]KAF2761734.1 Clavaminate synthase-like protein [Pseudovirgaria hyperparasitica]